MPSEDQLDGLATAFATLGSLHRVAPSDPVLTALHELRDEWPLAETEEAANGLDSWRRSELAHEDADAIRADLERIYGFAAVAVVSPYESVHRDPDRLVFDTSTLAVRQAYARLSLRAPALNREPDDHIGLEFGFVGQALLQALDEPDAGPTLGVVRAFLDDHLLAWAPVALTAVEQACATAFVRGLAQLSRGALASADAALS